MNHLSLFTGIGGLDLSAEWAGFHTVGQVEIDDYCNKVLEKHWPDVPRWRDIFELTGEEVEEKCGSISLLSGGFPCQPFSCAGKRRGTEDERYLWGEMLRIICEVRPRWVVAENVRGLLSIDAGRTFGTVLSDLAENGYRVGWLCYGAGDIGAPHRRERVFVVAYSSRELLRRRGASRQDGRGEFTNGSMANTNIRRGFSRGRQTDGMGMFQTGQGELEEAHRRQGNKGPTQPGVGRVPSRFPAGMDGNWPAIPGEQHEWEPPRIAIGIKDRVARLKALGNAVVPQQVYPIFSVIAEAEGLKGDERKLDAQGRIRR